LKCNFVITYEKNYIKLISALGRAKMIIMPKEATIKAMVDEIIQWATKSFS
jgi:hypothetical protein